MSSMAALDWMVTRLSQTGRSLSFSYLCKSRVPNQNGVSLLYIMLETHHSDQEPSKCVSVSLCVLLSLCLAFSFYRPAGCSDVFVGLVCLFACLFVA